MKDIQLQRLNPLVDPAWDRRIADLPDATCFHGSNWAKVLHASYGYTPHYLGTLADGRLRSLLPLMEVDSWATGRRAVSLPFTDACPPCHADSESCTKLFNAARRDAHQRRWKYLELRGSDFLLRQAAPSVSFHGHRLLLQPEPDALFARLHKSTQRAVRKARQSALTIETSSTMESVRRFYALLCPTRRRRGVPPQPFSFFENIHRHMLARDQGRVVLVRLGSQPVAGALFLHFGRHALFKYGASLPRGQSLRANNLVLWHAIEWYARQGFAALDFGRTALADDGLRRFKLGWGTDEYRINYFRYETGAGRFVTAADPLHPWQHRFFRLLPASLSRLMGNLLYRHAA